MTRTIFLVMLLFALAALAGGCGLQAPVRPPIGLLYTSHKAPLKVDFDNTTLGAKAGEAHTSFVNIPIFVSWSFAWDKTDLDTLLEDAKAEGGITECSHADYDHLSVLGIYQRFTVVAHGE